MGKIYYDFWYIRSEEVELDGTESGRVGYELAIGVFADSEHYKQLDDLRISGLTKVEMLGFAIQESTVLFHKLQEEGLMNVVEDIKDVGYYRVMAVKKITVTES